MRQMGLLSLILIFWTSATVHAAKVPSSFESILRREPSFQKIIKAHYKKEGLGRSHIRKWEKKIRIAPMLPALSVGYDHVFRESEGLSNNDNISLSSGNITVGPQKHSYDYDSYLGSTFRVRAVWRLDELVFNRYDLALSKEKRDLAKMRTDVGGRVGKVYDDRYLYLLKYLQVRSGSKQKARIFYGRYLILTQKLNALTGGIFKKRWWKK